MKRALETSFLCTTLLLLVGCGGGGGGGAPIAPGPTPQPTPPDPTVSESLAALGIDTTATPRLGDNSRPLPDSYSPLGSTWEVGRKSEIFYGGARVDGFATQATLLQDLESVLGPWGPIQSSSLESLGGLQSSQLPWLIDLAPKDDLIATKRAATAADVDGDGREEIAMVYVDGNQLKFRVEYVGQSRPEFDGLVSLEAGLTHVAIAADDFDGDGNDELVIGYARDSDANFTILEDEAQSFTQVANSTRTYVATLFGHHPSGAAVLGAPRRIEEAERVRGDHIQHANGVFHRTCHRSADIVSQIQRNDTVPACEPHRRSDADERVVP